MKTMNNLKTLLPLVATLAIVVPAGLGAAQTAGMSQPQMMAKAETFTGVLIDNACFKADMTAEDLAAHTRDCALMEGCVESGYVVVTADKHVYKLDMKGNEAAVAALKASKQAGNLRVTVTGTNDMGTIKVQTIVLDKM